MSYLHSEQAGTVSTGVRHIGDVVVRWLPLLIVTGLWEFASGWVVIETILPPPSDVLIIAVDLVVSGQIVGDLLVSLWRIVWGLGLAISVGVVLGVTMAQVDPVEDFFSVFMSLIYPLPKTALVPLAVLWLGSGSGTAILVVFLACLLPIVLNSYNAAESVDQNLVWSAKMMGTSDRDLFRRVVVPAAIPEIMTGIRQAVPIAFVSLVSAELIAANRGIGYRILSYGQLGVYESMLAVIVIISLAAYVGVRGFERIERRVLVWT